MSFGLEQEVRSLITPMALAHPLHLVNNRSRNKHKTCGLEDVLPPDDLCSRPETVLMYIFLNACILFTSSGYRTYIYIHRECCSVLVKLHPSQSIGLVLGSVRFLCWMSLFVFFGFTNCVLFYDNKTHTRMLVTIDIRFKQHLTLDILRSAISHLLGYFCPWTFPNYGFNIVPSGPFMTHLDTQLGYSTGEFPALQLIVLVVFGVVD